MELEEQSRPLAGILWMLATGMAFVVVNGTVRALGTDLPAAQSAFIRFAYGLLFLLPTLVPALRRDYGGCPGHIPHALRQLGGQPLPLATLGNDGGG